MRHTHTKNFRIIDLLFMLIFILLVPKSALGLSIANTGLSFVQGFDSYRFTVSNSRLGEGEDGIRDFEIEMSLIRDGKVLDTQTLQIEHFASCEADSIADIFFEIDMAGNEPTDGSETGPISFSISKATGKIDGKIIDFIKEDDLFVDNFVPAKIKIASQSK